MSELKGIIEGLETPFEKKKEKNIVYSGSAYPKDDRYNRPVGEDEALIYTDGGGSSWCYIYIDSERWILRSKFEEDVTSNSMELTAIARGLQLAHLLKKKATFFSDSQYAVNSVNAWMHKWEKNGWKRGKQGEVKNLAVIKVIFHIKRAIEVNGVWIKGHDGHLLNEICDSIVNESASRGHGFIIEAKDLSELREKLRRININL